MSPRLQKLYDALAEFSPKEDRGEITIEVKDLKAVSLRLRDQHGFEQMIDLCGVDYAAYGDRPRENRRFAVVVTKPCWRTPSIPIRARLSSIRRRSPPPGWRGRSSSR